MANILKSIKNIILPPTLTELKFSDLTLEEKDKVINKMITDIQLNHKKNSYFTLGGFGYMIPRNENNLEFMIGYAEILPQVLKKMEWTDKWVILPQFGYQSITDNYSVFLRVLDGGI